MSRLKMFLSGMLASISALVLVGTPVMAASASPVYDALPTVSPQTSYPSQPFQAQQTAEFGDYVHLGGTSRKLHTVNVTMVTWARFSEYQSNPAYLDNNSSWTHPIKMTVYGNQLSGGVPNNVLAQKTVDIAIPWRPEGDATCPDSGYGDGFAWKDSTGTCRNGLAFNASFDMSDLNATLPDDVIVGIAYNTQTYGANPTGVEGPYNSLNVAVPPNQTTSIGNDVDTGRVFWNTSTAGWYSDGGASGVGIFREDTNWAPYGTVAIQITATPPLVGPPTKITQCLKNGWKKFNNPKFKSQASCITYVVHKKYNHVKIKKIVKYIVKTSINQWLNPVY